jgi:hypothetical protein
MSKRKFDAIVSVENYQTKRITHVKLYIEKELYFNIQCDMASMYLPIDLFVEIYYFHVDEKRHKSGRIILK